ncbi:MAG: hypothetical protein JSV96_17720 [Candidatus Aminicenantes bacterium]|nr:MAG: hypothetical protein JSV96_17720 [Candidatus Aminicenantes bacterium]
MKNGSRNFILVGDEATLETRVVNASRNIQFLGPYSRFGWNHPGPVYFYLLLPFYALFSMGTQSLYVEATFIGILSVLILLFFLYKNENNYFFLFTAFFFSLYIYGFLGLHIFRNIWNPHVTILPFTAFIFISVHLSRGNLIALPLSILFFSFVIQTHVAYAPVVVVMFLISVLLYILEKLRFQRKIKLLFSTDALKIVGVSVGLFLVLWILPIIETFRNPPGNLLKLIYYFTRSKVSHGIPEAAAAVSNMTNAPFIKFFSILFPNLEPSARSSFLMLFLIQLLLVIAAGVYHFLSRRKYQFNLLLFGASGLIISVISVTKITGEIHSYLIQWMSVIGFINWCAVFFTFFCLLTELSRKITVYGKVEAFFSKVKTRHKRILLYSIVVLIAVVLFIRQQESVYSASQIKQSETRYKHVGEISDAIRNYVEKNNIPSFLLGAHHSLWVTEAGVVNQLFKSSVSFSLENNWLFWFGYQFKQHKEEKDIIFFMPEREPRKNTHNRFLIYSTSGCSVYHKEKD